MVGGGSQSGAFCKGLLPGSAGVVLDEAGGIVDCATGDGFAHSFSIVDDLWDVELLIHCRGGGNV